MYESPINIIQGEMQMQLEGEVYKAIQKVGVDVDKEELLKALQYDREQYKKGYNDAIEEFINWVWYYINKYHFRSKEELEMQFYNRDIMDEV